MFKELNNFKNNIVFLILSMQIYFIFFEMDPPINLQKDCSFFFRLKQLIYESLHISILNLLTNITIHLQIPHHHIDGWD